MTARGFALFDTPVGRSGIAWSGRGIAGVQLPEANDGATRARMLRRHGGARELPPPEEIRRVIESIIALLSGEAVELCEAFIDMEGVPPFDRRVYEVARTIRPGATLTYGEVAARIGEPGSARDVGQALARNPFPIIVPCHRVLAAGGKLGGFSARGGAATKRRLLAIEAVHAEGPPRLF
jgi:methylated-DNA-[protein]-cysteine S-methyltransferase